jgi:hypothetical protein
VSRPRAFLGWLEDLSDWLSPLVVKEVRQIVRGREFFYSFSASLVAGLAVAFFGAADAATGSGTAGNWTFFTLIGCLAFVGFLVVPAGAFNALRTERTEQTLDLITLTALSPRRVVVGKLLAQGVKLATLFAAMAPFVAMCFLLGGVDLVTILVTLAVLFMWSLWACALFLFLSTLFKSRAMSGFVFGAAGLLVLMILLMSRPLFFAMSRGAVFGVGALSGGVSPGLWVLAIAMTACLATMANLVLLAENRLSLPTEDRVTRLRIGLFVQFLLMAGWVLMFVNGAPRVRVDAVEALAVVGGLHLALVAFFTVTEDLVVPRRVRLRLSEPSRWKWLLAIFRPGGGRGAAYVLVQMALLLIVAWLFEPEPGVWRWLLAICGYICFFVAVPTVVYRWTNRTRPAALRLRVAILLLLAAASVLPDAALYVLFTPDTLDLDYAQRHLISPFRTLANWRVVEAYQWVSIPLVLGATGLLASLALIHLGMRVTARPLTTGSHDSAATAGEPGSANLY